VKVKDVGDGTYDVAFTPIVVGPLQVDVAVAGKPK
jgi:hypothetical protein